MLQIALLVCWAVFVAVWALGALYNARYAPTTVRRDSMFGLQPWQSWIVGAVAALLLHLVVPRSLWAATSFRTDWLGYVGLLVLLGSTSFALWARWTLGTMWSSVPALRAQHELHTDGPYRFTRHPIYTGILGMVLGSTLVAGFGLIFVVLLVCCGVFLVRIPREEQLMLETFGEQYVRYSRRVPRLVPFLHV